jgi:hypothetical protein
MVNVIKNLADKPLDIDPKEYEEMVKEEMVKSGLLNEKNFIDDRKIAEEAGMEEIAIPKEEVKPQVAEKEGEASRRRGPSGAHTHLLRSWKPHHVYLPIPIYKCQGAGQITLAIVVDRSGNVLKAEPASKLSSTKDPCLIETAVEHAFKSRFNADQSAPEKQAGFLTFVFVSQN